MRNELDEKLKNTLGSPPPLDIELFTNNVMRHLREELKKEKQHLSLVKHFRRLMVFYRDGFKAMFFSHPPKPFARRYSPVFKITVGLTAASAAIILICIFLAHNEPSTSPNTYEFSEMLHNTSPRYVLKGQVNIQTKETRPCDILPSFLD